MKISIFGLGTWGTALAQVLIDNGHDVFCWTYDEGDANNVNLKHENTRYFPNIVLPSSLRVTTNIDEVVNFGEIFLLSVPTVAMRSILSKIKNSLNRQVIFLNTAKGFDPEEDITISNLIREIIPSSLRGEPCSLLGPSHAEEVILRHITLICAVSNDEDKARIIQNIFSNDYFRVYTLKDEIGAEYQTAMKNAIALASGMIEGLKLGDNARAALVTRGLVEIGLVASHFGAKKETLYGLTGIGDLMVTCYSYHSRNFEAGLKIGRDDDVSDFLKTNKKTVEGIRTVKVLHELGERHHLRLPIIEALYQIIYEGKKPSIICRSLMLRPLKSED